MSATLKTKTNSYSVASGKQTPKSSVLKLNYKTVDEGNHDTHFFEGQDERSTDGILRVNAKYRATAKAPDFLPSWDPNEKYGPLTFHEYDDPALRADPTFSNLFPKDKENEIAVRPITPKLGSEIKGIQLSHLSDAAKDELALLIAQRGVVVLREQDFAEKGPRYVADFVSHFGKLHIHQSSGHPEDVAELHVTYRRPDEQEFERLFADRTSSIFWHSDVSYELQPPSYTFFTVLEGPNGGGDTLFSDGIEAYERLSPTFQNFLSRLHVVHSGIEQAEHSKRQGGIERRKASAYIHPLIRYHPVLKRKSIFADPSFSRRIVELKKQESDLLLKFLFDLIGNTHDIQLRANWESNTVAIWDNRRVHHSAVVDWEKPVSRHAVRITPQGERPVEDPKYLNDPSYYPDPVNNV
ncbi:hypothetical protein HG535_0B00200 [Zygotorulaspora mrakii]|uniref:TauD/TfdA-like domain-containing protein n=1 Tax=Zygotorulaspora mrakii TaxID=42260 RepID=A0A7H9AXK1_ZYGMR|nr:uncharacterized protein HG535_0B00200 [Zygotorulaspora mrakii]QLG70983.1 hypothetical protein HG535_0B00200 [Zygotorulaspora mrakii]